MFTQGMKGEVDLEDKYETVFELEGFCVVEIGE